MWFGQQLYGAYVSYKVPRKIRFPKNILYRLNNQEGVLTAAVGITQAIPFLFSHSYFTPQKTDPTNSALKQEVVIGDRVSI